MYLNLKKYITWKIKILQRQKIVFYSVRIIFNKNLAT